VLRAQVACCLLLCDDDSAVAVPAPVAAPIAAPVAAPVAPADPLSSGPRARAVLEAEEARYAEIVARDQAARARLLDVSAVGATVSHSGCIGSGSV
jgi:hypothetical protein